MQKRLFLLLFPMMFLPAVTVMFIDWNTSRQHLEVLDGPGLSSSFDASLKLARRFLDEEKAKTRDQALQLANSTDLEGTFDPQGSWWLVSQDSEGDWRNHIPSPHSPQQPPVANPEAFIKGRRLKTSNGTVIRASAPLPDNSGTWLVVSRNLDPELASMLDDVTRGGAGVRQLRLFYSKLLRSNLLLTFGLLTLLLLLVSLALSHRLARYVARPLKELSLGTEKVAAGDLEHRVKVKAPAELGQLVQAFNGMTAQLQQGRLDLRRAERVAAWQGVARRLAHEIKNPLTPITLAMHRIGKKSEDETVQSCVRTVLEESANLGRLADEFAMYAKLPKPRRQEVSADQLHELLESVARFYLARTRVKHQWQGWPGDFTLSVDAGQLRQVLSNLIKNGNEAMGGQGVLVFGLQSVERPGQPVKSEHLGPWMRLSISDSGPGLPADAEDVFEPYVTSKSTGTGLGLAVSRRMVEDNGGCLWAKTSVEGATFILELPQLERASS